MHLIHSYGVICSVSLINGFCLSSLLGTSFIGKETAVTYYFGGEAEVKESFVLSFIIKWMLRYMTKYPKLSMKIGKITQDAGIATCSKSQFKWIMSITLHLREKQHQFIDFAKEKVQWRSSELRSRRRYQPKFKKRYHAVWRHTHSIIPIVSIPLFNMQVSNPHGENKFSRFSRDSRRA